MGSHVNFIRLSMAEPEPNVDLFTPEQQAWLETFIEARSSASGSGTPASSAPSTSSSATSLASGVGGIGELC